MFASCYSEVVLLWETKFSIDCLTLYREIIVFCETLDAAEHFIDELCGTNVRWSICDERLSKLDPSDTRWNYHKGLTCYRIRDGLMSIGSKNLYERRFCDTPKFTYACDTHTFQSMSREDICVGLL